LQLRKLHLAVSAFRQRVLVFNQVLFVIFLNTIALFTSGLAEASIILPGPAARPSGATAYETFSLFPQGSNRAMGLGGAYTALSDDIAGLGYNPSGLAFGNWKVDAGGTNNRVNNREIDLAGDGTGYPSAYNFILYGVGARLGEWAIALGVSTPYESDQEFGSFSTKVQITSLDVLLARKFGENFSVGISGHGQTLKENYSELAGGQYEEQASQNTYTAGVTYRTKELGIGVSYTPAVRFTIDSTKNSQLKNSAVFFRDGVVPAKTAYGMFYNFTDRFMITADADSYDGAKNTIYTGSGVTGFDAPIDLDSGSHIVVHGGFEWKLVQSKETTLTWRAGAYHEPNRKASNGRSREHLTLGLEVRFGPAVLGVAFDQATDFNNTAQGFSISFGAI
jgi:hypothetical protein